jgi:hypothetical protein
MIFSLDYNSEPWWIVVGDFDNDDHLDIVLPIIALTILIFFLDMEMELFLLS